MANPSDTGPSGIGTEVLRRVEFNGLNNTTQTVLTVGTDMIVTLLSIIITNITGTANTAHIHVARDGSGNNTIYNGNTAGDLPADSTFVFSEKVVLVETDVLKVQSNSINFDVWVSYIEQEFA